MNISNLYSKQKKKNKNSGLNMLVYVTAFICIEKFNCIKYIQKKNLFSLKHTFAFFSTVKYNITVD